MPLVVDVEALLERLGIQAKRRGREWWACCPFHEERTPSWQIHDDDGDLERHGRWRCLGKCHDGGGSIGLVMRIVGFERAREAIEWMRSGLAFDRPSAGRIAAAGGGLELGAAHRPRIGFKLPSTVRFIPFEDWPDVALTYARSRNLDAELVERWGLGIAIDGRLHGRIVMPWRDGAGRLGGYTARAYVPGEKKKYLEPATDEGASSGWVYGEEHWPAERRRLVVVEGGFDGFAVERATDLPFGAARGSNLVNGHVLRFGTFDELVLLVDPDGAGERFAEAIIGKLGRHKTIKRVELEDGYDAAKYSKKFGASKLADKIENAEPV
jgi:DNA primase